MLGHKTLNPLNLTYLQGLALRASLHLEARPIYYVRGLKYSLVIGQRVKIGSNPFTLSVETNLVEWIFFKKDMI